jgi:hypothetical protein
MEHLENIHALTKRDEKRLSDLKKIVKAILQKHDILYMRNKGKNKTKNTNKRGFEMMYHLKNNGWKIAGLLFGSYVVYTVVSLLIGAVSFAHKVS